jgi:uncharacterized membrane protein
MPRTTFAGHPAHPILVAFPIGLLFFGSVVDLWDAASPDERREYAAYLGHVSGLGTSVLAAATGLSDFVSLPKREGLRRTGLIHGLLNSAVVIATGVNIWAHRRNKSKALRSALSTFQMAGLFVSSWYGASLIYEGGVRVAGVDPLAGTTEYKPAYDDEIRAAFAKLGSPSQPSERAAKDKAVELRRTGTEAMPD